MSSTDTSASSTSAGSAPPNAALAGHIALGGDVSVNRLGFGAMRITGPGIWGEPRDPAEARAYSGARSSLASRSSTPPTPTVPRSANASSQRHSTRTRTIS